MLLVLCSRLKEERCYHGLDFYPVKNILIDSYGITLVSPSGQGGEVPRICNNFAYLDFVPALFSPLERSLFCFGIATGITNRQWKPGWAPPVRLIIDVNRFSLE